MEWTSLNDLRNKFLDFFESKGHKVLSSFSLIPQNDNSLLLINSGMAPMKKYFTGEITPPKKRVTTCQKCIRTPDIDRVGITARHGTFFEMLGNFSFGDYFKTDACTWAWEFCTKVLELPIDRLWVSIYQDDDEAFEIWTKKVGVSADRIVKLGKEDNFWEHGLGPCGPCSELYFDRGEEYGCHSPECQVGCDCDRYVEFWNLVFTQFDSDGRGNYTPLAHPNIDTGMGLERLACIMQEVDNLFLVDSVQNIIKKVEEITNVKYGVSDKTDVSIRIITDHVRSVVFMIGDGVIPSNEGRGYVLRRLLRRASRHGRILGIKEQFLYKICETVIEVNKETYTELEEKRVLIKEMIKSEEDIFEKTIDVGLRLLNDLIEKSDYKTLSGEAAFKLSDTYGFPIDLTTEILAEKNMSVDKEKFQNLMLKQKKLARDARKSAENDAWFGNDADLTGIKITEFTGYNSLVCDSVVLAIIKGNEKLNSVSSGEKIGIVLDKTSMYAQSGGQIGDIGIIKSNNVSISVLDTVKNANGIFIHSCIVNEGSLSVGDKVTVYVNELRRENITRNHTAAHILQAALRKVLGNHVEQAGQLVNDEHLRFDFTHFSPLSKNELDKVEYLVNLEIMKAVSVSVKEMPIKEAQSIGAMALFGEKYSDIVRVVRMQDDFSIELCGGTHVDNTSKIGLFKIISENSVASGVRRITANTGLGVLKVLNDSLNIINECSAVLKINDNSNLVAHCKSLIDEKKAQNKEIEILKSKISVSKIDSILNNFENVNGLKVITASFNDMGSKELKNIGDQIRDKIPEAVAVIAGISAGKASFMCTAGNEAVKKAIHCGKLVSQVAAITGAKGGGKPNFAMAGIKDTSKIEDALNSVKNIIIEMAN